MEMLTYTFGVSETSLGTPVSSLVPGFYTGKLGTVGRRLSPKAIEGLFEVLEDWNSDGSKLEKWLVRIGPKMFRLGANWHAAGLALHNCRSARVTITVED